MFNARSFHGLQFSAVALLVLSACKADPPAPTTSTAATGDDLSGSYKITSATNPGGVGGYAGGVQLTRQGDHYTVDWAIANTPPYKGVAIVEGQTLGVGWGTGQNYGVAVYKVDGGTLTGKWATFLTQGKVGTEKLSGPTGLSGEYQIVEATTPGGTKGYAGTVTITPQGETYAVTWKLANESYGGVGILRGNVFVVGWGTGGGGAGVVSYGIGGRKLDGTWAQPGGKALGTEVLAKN